MAIIDNLLNITPFNWIEILSALIAGGIIGIERQLSGKPIGIRTSILICISTYIFATFCSLNPQGIPNPAYIIGQIITGIGFLGAGVILTRDGIVLGVTSAACIWILAAIGITIGLNYPYTGVKLALLAVILLTGIDKLEKHIPFLHKGPYKKQNTDKKNLQQRTAPDCFSAALQSGR
ncbi:MAG: MgtC/SapB family protein [Candidatus Omnitrophota bacterium]